MPTVRTYGPRQVATAPIAGVKKTAAESGLSEGAGVEQAKAQRWQTVAGLAGDLGGQATRKLMAMGKEASDNADETAVLAGSTKVQTKRGKLLFGDAETGDLGAFSVKGKAALDMPRQVHEAFSTYADEIEAGLTNDRQRTLFRLKRMEQEAELDVQLQRHVSEQMQAYDLGEVQAHIENNVALAQAHALDPAQAERELIDAEVTIKQAAVRFNWGPQKTAQVLASTLSEGRAGMVRGLLAAGKDLEAKVYFQELGHQIIGPQRAEIEKAVKTGSTIGDAQRVADTVTATAPTGTLTEWRDAVKTRTQDPDVREHAMALVNQADAVREKQNRDDHEAVLLRVFQATRKGQRVDPNDLAAMTGPELSGLNSFTAQTLRGLEPENQSAVFDKLYRMATAPETREAFAELPMMTYRHQLDNPHFDRLVELQGSVRGSKDRSLIATATIDQQQFDRIANSAGLPVYKTEAGRTEADRESLALLRDNVEQAIARDEAGKKRPLSREEKGALMTRLVDQHVMIGVWSPTPIVAAAATRAQQAEAYVAFADIPRVNLESYVNYVRSVSPATFRMPTGDLLVAYKHRFEQAFAAQLMKLGDAEVQKRLRGEVK